MDDLISRAEAIRVASGYCHWANIPEELAKLPSVNPKPCEDAISRQDALEVVNANKTLDGNDAIVWIEKEIGDLPSVTPAPKIGRWIEKEDYNLDTYYECSVCSEPWTTIDGTPWDNGMNYCPNCGAKMEGVEK